MWCGHRNDRRPKTDTHSPPSIVRLLCWLAIVSLFNFLAVTAAAAVAEAVTISERTAHRIRYFGTCVLVALAAVVIGNSYSWGKGRHEAMTGGQTAYEQTLAGG